jgi:hypothetical protein
MSLAALVIKPIDATLIQRKKLALDEFKAAQKKQQPKKSAKKK